MIPGALITKLKMLTESTVRSAEPVRAVQPDPAPLNPGDRFNAVVLARNADGTYRAESRNLPLTLKLPIEAEPGEKLDLVVSSREPAPPSERRGFTIVARLVPPAPGQTAAPRLSETARLIGSLLTESPAPAVALAGGGPIADSADTPPARIASLLRDAVRQSGVFYESHQADWVEGRVSLAALHSEPQARLPPGSRLAVPDSHSVALRPERPEAPERSGNVASAPVEVTGARPGDSVTTIVHRQLDALSTHQLAWQVQPWPGQHMEWEIDAPDDRDGNGSDVTEREWQTRLRLTLPNLGEVGAALTVSGNRIGIRLQADADGTARLRNAGPALADAFAAAGLQLVHVTVASHE